MALTHRGMVPDREEHARKYHFFRKLIVETHTSENEPNYLTLAQVQFPLQDANNDACHRGADPYGGYGAPT